MSLASPSKRQRYYAVRDHVGLSHTAYQPTHERNILVNARRVAPSAAATAWVVPRPRVLDNLHDRPPMPTV